jgi:uncharacterized membrane protein YGL010W
MLCLPQPPDPLVEHWLARHRDPISFALHMIGIPPTIFGVLMIPIYLSMASIPLFLLALAAFVGGFLIQFLGHAIEGTDPGEIIMIKKKLGWSYVEFPPPRKPRRRSVA